MSREIDRNQALILSGGGGYGAYEVGVMKALLTGECATTNHDFLNPGVLTGTSVGAYNAAYIVSRPREDICDTVRGLESIWLDKLAQDSETCGNGVFRVRANPLRYLNPNCFALNPFRPAYEVARDSAFLARDWFDRSVNFLLSAGSVPNRALELVDISAFVSSEPILSLFRETLTMEEIRNSNRKLRVVATDWTQGEVKVFENRDMVDEFGYLIIQGSASIPGIFRPTTINGHGYVDGGVLMNTPLKCAIQAGATSLHVIYMDPDLKNISVQVLQSVINTLDRMLLITSANKVKEDIETAAWINEGLAVIARAARGEISGDADMQAFIRVAGHIYQRMIGGDAYKMLTIHRYHPHDDLGGGTIGLLNLERSRMVALIERGFNDAVAHDCVKSHCVLPIK